MSKVYFNKVGNQFYITSKAKVDLHESLPIGTYSVNFNQCRGEYFLETINDFQLKGKIYGDVLKNSDRILNTFFDRPKSTGVLLVGEKGSGKTLLAQYISIAAAKEKAIPTIVINKPYHGDEFNLFLQSIQEPVVILMDEFEKVYTTNGDENYQEQILTLFDGVYSSQKLFLLTCNDKYRMDYHMMNRPGRLYYMLEFNGLEASFVEEYCQDNLLQKEYIPAITAISGLFQSFNFDMLKAMVEDMNRYNEGPADVLKYLNIRPDGGGREKFSVSLIINGDKKDNVQKMWRGDPLSGVICIYSEDGGGEEGGKERESFYFSAMNLQNIDAKKRVFRFQNEAKAVLVLTPAPSLSSIPLNYDALASSAMKRSLSMEGIVDTDDFFSEEKKYEAMVYADY
jgi:hypothetical protein